MGLRKDVIFVGMNPSKVKVSRSRGSAYKRFHSWLDELDVDFVSFTNLSPDPYWDFRFKTFDHDFLCTSLEGYDKIVAWGTMVSSYLSRLGYHKHFTLPHPSPRNRQLNDHKYISEKLDQCKEYLHD